MTVRTKFISTGKLWLKPFLAHRVTPEEVWESAKKRVFGLEAAISAMIANGIDETSSEVTSLKDSLAKAKRNAQEPSLSIQLKGVMGFTERVRKRLVAHDAQRAVLEKELVDGETRVQRLGGRSFCGASDKACRVGCRGLSVEGET